VAALELEQAIRECLMEEDRDKIKLIIDQLCRDFAYAVHHPNARNGGLIGLAAAAIALGQNEVAGYLEDIIHPVLACFGDQDARVRYYACESMYNIAKVAKGEILLYFNEIFDALCKLATDSEPSVKNGADLLDRLIKDIVAEKAATYVSVIPKSLPKDPTLDEEPDPNKPTIVHEQPQDETTFSLPKFIPLLMERIYAINPFARMFLVSWITLLDSIPDLELISYLPSFLGGLISFLNDPSKDVRVATHAALDGFLQEIRRITDIKKTVALNQERKQMLQKKTSSIMSSTKIENESKTPTVDEPQTTVEDAAENASTKMEDNATADGEEQFVPPGNEQNEGHQETGKEVVEREDVDNDEDVSDEGSELDGLYIPGQDVYINFDKIIEILISHLDSSEEEIQLTVLNWIENLLDVSPLCLLPYGPRFLSVLLPTMAYEGNELRHAAERVNRKLQDLIMALPDDSANDSELAGTSKLDYPATVNSLTLHFLNEKEETRVAALDWLIMLHRKVPKKILAINDGTFPALLKTLSDPSEQVITKDLQLLAQISYNSDDEYFTAFMVNLLNLFSTDRRLLETRGNLIIRQLCVSLNPERIYRTLAEIIEQDDDMEFASIMVQNLNNNLITAPELSDLRTRLRNLDNKDGIGFFVSLFKSWCHNSAAALSLCLLAQAYEHAFLVMQIIVEFEITVSLLVQIDRLVQLLESPVFTQLRLQLLEPEKYPYLYKCLYGILMILPQSSAFNTLRNRLNSVSPIGFIHLPPKPTNSNSTSSSKITGKYSLQGRDDVKWTELLEKFRNVQRKHQDIRNNTFSKSFSDLKLYNPDDYTTTTDSDNGPRPQKRQPPHVKTYHQLQNLPLAPYEDSLVEALSA
jgi:vacuole morphology and inheritance protein 14